MPAYAGVVAEMKAELTRLMAHYKDDGATVATFDNPDQPPPMPKAKKAKQAKQAK